ncbi:inositol polyphosphate 1-phosphatase-like [Littorina saxatilis]|uniref:inositol-1,4-bisphosphate 1-phosphatase n=1 Tax=Littorina saxatilis TaxID=31220 RepID=A0AAN9BTA0_9CAEN
MKVCDLLVSMLQASMKARDVARIIRSEPALLHLLVEEKKGAEKNKRFVQDFKTLADVLIQQMVSHDIATQFPEMEGSIFGEESNQFTNALGETTTVRLCDTPEQTKHLLKDVLDDNEEAALLLSQAVHRQATAPHVAENLDAVHATIPADDVGIWIDPIDSTAQYIRGEVGQVDSDGVTNGGLQCVAVLIGAFQKSTGLPIVGVAVQPFWELDPASQQWSDNVTWGVSYQDVRLTSISKCNQKSASYSLPSIVMSTSESDAVKQTLSGNFQLRFASGAGYKLLCTAQRRVDAYVLSKSSIYVWDCCAPHAILRATGGGLVRFQDTVTTLKTYGVDKVSDETVKDLQVSYSPSAVAQSCGKSINGVIAYSSRGVLDKIMQSLVE